MHYFTNCFKYKYSQYPNLVSIIIDTQYYNYNQGTENCLSPRYKFNYLALSCLLMFH